MDNQILAKTCAKCGTEKEHTEFHKNPSTKDGLRSSCKVCISVPNAAYNAKNPEKSLARNVKWRKENPEKSRAKSAAYRAANPEKRRVAVAKWWAANPEKRRIYEQNREARKREAGGRLSPGLAAKLFKLQEGKCPCCKEPLGNDYHLDHIIPIALGGSNEDSNLQLLRQRCNGQKGAKHPIEFMQSRGFLL